MPNEYELLCVSSTYTHEYQAILETKAPSRMSLVVNLLGYIKLTYRLWFVVNIVPLRREQRNSWTLVRVRPSHLNPPSRVRRALTFTHPRALVLHHTPATERVAVTKATGAVRTRQTVDNWNSYDLRE